MPGRNLFGAGQLVLGLSLLLMTAPARADPPEASKGQAWQAVDALTDDFSRYDAAKWQIGHPYWQGRPPSVFHAENASFGDGLKLYATVHKSDVAAQDWLYTACVTSKTAAFTVGMYAEARMKAADLSVTSDFWMQGKYSEIDVAENWGRASNRDMAYVDTSMMMATHYFANGWQNDLASNSRVDNPGQARNADGYHVYGVWFKDARTILFYLDGQQVGTVAPKGDFDEAMYMFFDVEPEAWGPGLPAPGDITDGKNFASYSYVRTWTLVGA